MTESPARSIYSYRGVKSYDSPSSDGDHLGIGGHEELSPMAHAVVPLGAAHPGVLGALGVQREQERLTCAKVCLAVAALVSHVALIPTRRAVRPKHLPTLH